MPRITVIDSWKFKFTQQMIDYWAERGHEIQKSIYWGPDLVTNSDITYFAQTDNNLIQASRKQEKPPNVFIIAEAVDIDIYSGHPGAVDWESGYVDALIFYAEHMMSYCTKTFGQKIPDDIPRCVIPGGVDLARWDMRGKERGYNIAWIGRLWIAKNLFDALQIFYQLIKTDPSHPWHLHCLGKGWSPPHWWRRHCEAYLAANPALAKRVTFTESIKDVNAWLEDKDWLLQTSVKESFGYVVAESAAKGIRPIIQFTTGVLDIWPREWVFDTHDEAVSMLLSDYDPLAVRGVIEERYPLARRMAAIDEIAGISV